MADTKKEVKEEIKEEVKVETLPFLLRLRKVQTELKAPKGQTNKFGGYRYRSCEDILEAVKPLLDKYSLVLTLSDDIEFVEGRHYVKAIATLMDIYSDKTLTTSALAREEESKKGMDGSQITGASSSYARKYCLNGLFNIDDTKDSDATNDGSNQQEKPKSKQPLATKAQVDYLKSYRNGIMIKWIKEHKGRPIEELTEVEAKGFIEALKRKEEQQ